MIGDLRTLIILIVVVTMSPAMTIVVVVTAIVVRGLMKLTMIDNLIVDIFASMSGMRLSDVWASVSVVIIIIVVFVADHCGLIMVIVVVMF